MFDGEIAVKGVPAPQLEWALQTQRALTVAAVAPGGLLGIAGHGHRC